MTERLKVYFGPMFSGKTTSLGNEIRLAVEKKDYFISFRPMIDNRSKEKCSAYTHDNIPVPSLIVDNPHAILSEVERVETDKMLPKKVKVVFIDEAQFFGDEIIDVIKILLEKDIKVVIFGLAHDFRDEPFGSMPDIIEIANEKIELTAKCTFVDENGNVCGRTATKTQRIVDGIPAEYHEKVVLVGTKEYEARCPEHHFVPGKPESVVIFSTDQTKD